MVALAAIAALAWYLRTGPRADGGRPGKGKRCGARGGRRGRRSGRARGAPRARSASPRRDRPTSRSSSTRWAPSRRGHGAVRPAGLRRAHAGAVQGRPDGQEGPAARDHRPAAVRDGAAAGARRAHARRGAARRRARQLQRFQTLLEQDSIARQEVDTQAALVKQLEARWRIDRANEGTARLNLGYTRIVAPIAGRVGLRPVDVGNPSAPATPTASP